MTIVLVRPWSSLFAETFVRLKLTHECKMVLEPSTFKDMRTLFLAQNQFTLFSLFLSEIAEFLAA